jgi:PAS domain S-box-containing protein
MSILFPYLELIASLFILLLCFQIFTRHYANKVARFFALFALVAFLTVIIEYSVRIAFTLPLANNLQKISSVLWVFLFPMFAQFSLLFCKKSEALENPTTKVLLYLPAGILSIIFLFTNIMYTRFEIWPIGIVSQPSPWYWLFFLNAVGYSLFGIFLLYNFSRETPQPTVKKQAIFIASGSLLALTIGATTDMLIPLIAGARLLIPTAVLNLALMNLFIYIAMRRYSLFAISPAIAADVIIKTMPDALLATDFDGQVLFMNEEADKLFCDPEESCVGKPFYSLFKNREKYDQLYDEVVVKEKEILRFEAELVDPLGQHIPAFINANLLRDKIVGDTIGIIFVVRDARG